jgi:hypothetical protein
MSFHLNTHKVRSQWLNSVILATWEYGDWVRTQKKPPAILKATDIGSCPKGATATKPDIPPLASCFYKSPNN